MSEMSAIPEGIESYAAMHATVASALGTAEGIDQAANVAALVPVFGLIGQEFLASFAYAQANHVLSVGQLAASHAGSAAHAMASAESYRATDAEHASGLNLG